MAEQIDMNELTAAINAGKKDKVKELLRKVTPFTDDDFNDKYDHFYQMFKDRNTFADDEKLYQTSTLKKLAGFFKREIKSSAEQYTGFIIGIKTKNWNDIAREKSLKADSRNSEGALVYSSGKREGQEIVGDDWDTELYMVVGDVKDEGTPKAEFSAKEIAILSVRSAVRQTYESLDISPFVLYQFRANAREGTGIFKRLNAVNITRFVPIFGEKHVDFVKAAKNVKGMKERLKSISEVYDWAEKNRNATGDEKFNDFIVVKGNPVSITITAAEDKKNVVEIEDDTVDFQSETQLMKAFSDKMVQIPFDDGALNIYIITSAWINTDKNEPQLSAFGYYCEEKFLREIPKKMVQTEVVAEKKETKKAVIADAPAEEDEAW